MSQLAQAEPTPTRRGRRYLDGRRPGQGDYTKVVAVSLRAEDIDELERLGGGNRSEGVRRLLALARDAQLQ